MCIRDRAVTGGAVGSFFMSMKKGVSRGIFSNEAGLGTCLLYTSYIWVSRYMQKS